MIRKALLVILWFPLTVSMLSINLALLAHSARATNQQLSALAPQEPYVQLASAGIPQVLSANVIAADARALLLESFLRSNQSPMAPFAELIVKQADKHNLDFRLITAIAMCESNAGKRMPKKDEYNFAGIAVFTGQNRGKGFDSWEHAIEWVSTYIKERYHDRGITDLRDIGAIWAPPSIYKDYSWTRCVEQFQQSIY